MFRKLNTWQRVYASFCFIRWFLVDSSSWFSLIQSFHLFNCAIDQLHRTMQWLIFCLCGDPKRFLSTIHTLRCSQKCNMLHALYNVHLNTLQPSGLNVGTRQSLRLRTIIIWCNIICQTSIDMNYISFIYFIRFLFFAQT